MNIIDLKAGFIDRPMLIADRSVEPLLNSIDSLNMASIKLNGSASNNSDVKLDANGNCTIPVVGTLTHRTTIYDQLLGFRSYQSIREDMHSALALKPETLLLDVDSGGGVVSGCFDLHREIKEAAKHTRIIALCNGSTLSAAYLLASACTEIWISNSSQCGSVGVVSAHIDVSKKNEKQGLKVTYIYKGALKTAGNPHEPISKQARDNIQSDIDRAFNMFVDAVAQARPGLTSAAIRATEAGIFDAESAIANNFADRLVNEYKLADELKTSKPAPARNAATTSVIYKPTQTPVAASTPAPKISDLPQAADNPELARMLQARGTSYADSAAILKAAAIHRG